MPEYGSKLYWEKRYSKSDESFDWMCDYNQLEPTILPLMKNFKSKSKYKEARILIVGCGNADFSPDFVKRSGFLCKNITHIDYCNVVIEQQLKKYPKLDFRVMDALDMEFEDDTFDFIIDKSLIDTTLCYHDGHQTTEKLFHELHRVLKPGGRLVTISLHTEEEVKRFEFPDCHEYEFVVSTCKLVNIRRQEDEIDIRCLYHTLAVFDKVSKLSVQDRDELAQWHEDIVFNNALSDEQYFSMVEDALAVQEGTKDDYYKSYNFENSTHTEETALDETYCS